MTAFRDTLAVTSDVKPTIVMSEGHDPRVAAAAVAASASNIAKIICVGKDTVVRAALKSAGASTDVEIEDPSTSMRMASYVDLYVKNRADKGMTPEKAYGELLKPNFFAAAMVAAGDADGTIGGGSLFDP
ncbi:phosphate acyltransferase [Planktomarina sp.]|nr:phosphate acyltransferase [Planktomarina sp.]